MIIVVKIFAFILCILGVILSFMGLWGPLLIAIAYLLDGLATQFEEFNIWLFIFFLGLWLISEIIEAFSTGLGAKKFGASNLSFFTTLIFGILGAIWGTMIMPLIGTIIGTILGACLAAFFTELFLKGKVKPALKACLGVLAGKTGGILIKTFIAMFMAIWVIISLF